MRLHLYSIYGETIAIVSILRALGASLIFHLWEEQQSVSLDMGRRTVNLIFIGASLILFSIVNRWLSLRFNLLSSAIVGVTGVTSILTPSIDAALATFILAFVSTITNDVRAAFVQVEILNRFFFGSDSSSVLSSRR